MLEVYYVEAVQRRKHAYAVSVCVFCECNRGIGLYATFFPIKYTYNMAA